MRGRRWFVLGLCVGSLAYPAGLVVGHRLAHRSVLYPHTKE